MGFQKIEEKQPICQPQKVLILQGQSLFPTQLDPTDGVELIKHFFVVFPKAKFFKLLNNCSIIAWRTIWLFLFTISIPPDQPSSVVRTWLAILQLAF